MAQLVEMLRRLVLVGLMVLAQGSMLQLLSGGLVAAAFLLFQVQASPYKEMSDDFLASVCSFGLVCAFFCSYAFKDYELVGLEDIYARMSLEQRSLYIVNQTTLAFIMLANVLGTLFLSFMLFILQFIIEGRRLRRERRASRARRLRFKSNDEEVMPPDIGANHFHTFLSHVWGTGQVNLPTMLSKHSPMLFNTKWCSPVAPSPIESGPNAHRQAASCGDDC